jgi:hypothetical protein
MMTKRKRTYELRKGDQIPTYQATIQEIMSEPSFALGVADVRAGRNFRPAYTAWSTDMQWDYERGRQWARLAPASVVLKRNGRITREAVAWYMTADIP